MTLLWPTEAEALPQATLTRERRETYVALVKALGESSRSQVDGARVGEATAAFVARYDGLSSVGRATFDRALDSLGGEQFTELPPHLRLDYVRDALLDRAIESGGAMSRGYWVQEAVALASYSFLPADGKTYTTSVPA